MIAKQRDRKCASCRYYESSPLWRKGWCRNPLLYDPQTNHLVEADSLACSRTFIDYWEPREGTKKAREMATSGDNRNPRVAPSIPMQPSGPGGQPLRSSLSPLNRDRNPQLSIVPREPVPGLARDPMPDPGPLETPIGGQPTQEIEEVPVLEPLAEHTPKPTVAAPATMSWIDRAGGRLRVGLMGAILVALAVLAVVTVQRNQVFTSEANARATATSRAIAAIVPTDTPRRATATSAPTQVPPSATPAPPSAPTMGIGAQAIVSGLNGENLLVRGAPSRTAAIQHRLPEGTRVTVKDGPREADGFTWWDVTGWDNSGASGWVAGQFLTLALP